jgi:GrpB-like predicted nucleotidyltransferase (UPF0157 family)
MRVIIEEYQESWAEDFLMQKEIIQNALKDLNVSIDHVGSTSVTGLGAKPIIDILVGLENETLLDKTISPMQQNGFTYFKKYTPEWPPRRLFCKLKSLSNKLVPNIMDIGDNVPDFISQVNIRTVVKDTYDWKKTIAFRDFLKTHEKIRDEYYLLKKEISKHEFESMLKYNDAKNDFIKDVESRALVWYEKEQEKFKVVKRNM